MKKLFELNADWKSGKLLVKDMELPELYEKVMAGSIAVVHNAFSIETLNKIKKLVLEWGHIVQSMPPQTYIDENFHSIEAGISPRQKTEHNYHCYNFNQINELDDDDFKNHLLTIVEPLRIFQNCLTGNNANYNKDEQGYKLHPQFIQYPSGGGMFGKHTHGLNPQKIGLILSISQRGKDFYEGGTYFELDNEIIQTDKVHDIGDILLFRFDVPHGITEIDKSEIIDYNSDRGRWTFVLPYY